jgi:cell division septation protein DedD
MVHLLKHYALRLWTTLLIGGPAILWFLPMLDFGLNPVFTQIFAAVALLAVFFAVGAAFNLAGLRSIKGLMRAAEDWERDGSTGESEACYRRAIAVFDSFLPSPRARRRIVPDLADRLARFYKVRSDQSIVSDAFISSYLRLHPEDEELAHIWLQQAGSRGWLERDDQQLAARIGAALADSPAIQEQLARYCLMEERTDFSALETYRRLMVSAGRNAPADLVSQLADLFIEQGRADEWALPVYVRALQQAPGKTARAAGIAACLRGLGETRNNRPWIAAGRRLLEDVDPDRIARAVDRFQPPDRETEPSLAPAARPPAQKPMEGVARSAAAAFRSASAALGKVGLGLTGVLRWAQKSPSARRSFRWGALALAAVAAILLVINTAGYLFRSEKRPEAAAPVVRPTGRFTIQVAAYLKEEHARRYADELKRNGLDVYWTESSNDQKKWYQVRISRFEDKAAARAYGDTLKAKGIIEDYYIANYTPPQSHP